MTAKIISPPKTLGFEVRPKNYAEPNFIPQFRLFRYVDTIISDKNVCNVIFQLVLTVKLHVHMAPNEFRSVENSCV